MTDAQVFADQLRQPIVDRQIFDDWTSDLEQDDIADVLQRFVPACTACVTDIVASAANGQILQARAHKLVGLAGNFGAKRLSAVARVIETNADDFSDERTFSTLQTVLCETTAAFEALAMQRGVGTPGSFKQGGH